jgi:cholesterol transport system auxiliary component
MAAGFSLCSALLAGPGCGVALERAAQPALHDFGPSARDHKPGPGRWSAVSVDAPQWLQDPRIQYRLLYANRTQVRFYALDRWLAPPPELLAQRLSTAGGGGRYRLEIQLQRLEQVFDRPGNSHVVMAFRAKVWTPEANRSSVERVFRLRQAARTPDAAGAVEAFSGVVDRAIGMLCDWSAQLGRSR